MSRKKRTKVVLGLSKSDGSARTWRDVVEQTYQENKGDIEAAVAERLAAQREALVAALAEIDARMGAVSSPAPAAPKPPAAPHTEE